TSSDIPLFVSLINDLFPGVLIAGRDHAALEGACLEAASELKVIPTAHFMSKCKELYDTTQVRHGLMLVGAAMSSKSTILNVVSKALSRIAQKASTAHAAAVAAANAAANAPRGKGKAARETAAALRDAAAKAERAARAAVKDLGTPGSGGRASGGFVEV